jgi:creatinine amidohydrolase
MIDDIYRSITDAGLTSLVIVNCHEGNYVLANIVQEGNAHGKSTALFSSGADWTDARNSARLATSNHEDMHAGELETAILLHAQPELVRDGYRLRTGQQMTGVIFSLPDWVNTRKAA